MKILIVINGFANGGVEAVLINYLTYANLNGHDITVAGFGKANEVCLKKFADINIRTVVLPDKKKKRFKALAEFWKLLRKEKFDIVHANMSDWNFIPLCQAFFAGVKVRISHSHMAPVNRSFMGKMFFLGESLMGKLFANNYWACGIMAGNDLFGAKTMADGRVYILPNRVDYDRFTYSSSARDAIRGELNINGKLCVGTVGRLYQGQKNQKLLIDTLGVLSRERDDVVLLIVGSGPDEIMLKSYVEEKGLKGKVIFVPSCENVEDYYSSMDVFCLPSFYEGFAVVLVESQVEGLPTIASIRTSEETVLSDKCARIDIDNPYIWADKIEEMEARYETREGADNIDRFYSLKDHADEMIRKYEEIALK